MSETPDYTATFKALSLKELLRLVNNSRRNPEALLDILMTHNPENFSRPHMRGMMVHFAQLGEEELKTRQLTRSLSGRL